MNIQEKRKSFEKFLVDAHEVMSWEENYYKYQDNIELIISKEENLSNGEEIIVSVTVTGLATDTIKSREKTFTVSGLKEAELVDAFKDISIEFKGLNGEGSTVITNNSTDKFAGTFNYSFENNYKLTNGDKLVITVVYNVNEGYALDKIPSEKTKVYTFSGLTELAEEEDITKNIVQTISDHFCEIEEKENQSSWLFTCSDVKHYGSFFQTAKSDNARYKNILTVFIYEDRFYNGEYRDTIYMPIVFYNVTKETDGAVNINLDNAEHSTFCTYIDSCIAGYYANEEYSISKIN